AAETFAIDQKYKVQFERMHLTAQLPAKLFLYQTMFNLMHEASQKGKQLLIFTAGNPTMQLNKLRHIEWNGLDKEVKVYFEEELRSKGHEPFNYLLVENGLKKENVLYIHAGSGPTSVISSGLDCLAAARFLSDANHLSNVHNQ